MICCFFLLYTQNDSLYTVPKHFLFYSCCLLNALWKAILMYCYFINYVL
jgi:hypothetical protein